MGILDLDWIAIDKKLRKLWKDNEKEQVFLEAVAGEFNWSKRQTIQNTRHIFAEHGLTGPATPLNKDADKRKK